MFKFKSITLSFSFLLAFMFMGQQLDAQKLMDKLSDQACDQIKNLDKDLTAAEAEKALENVMVNVVMKNYSEISKEYNLDIANASEEDFVKIGEDLGMKLATDCPAFLTLAIQMGAGEMEEESASNTIEGQFLGVEGDDFVFVTVKDSAGKTQKLFWGASFSGDGDLMNAKKLKGKSVVVSFTEKECYNAKLKDYSTLREITSLEVK